MMDVWWVPWSVILPLHVLRAFPTGWAGLLHRCVFRDLVTAFLFAFTTVMFVCVVGIVFQSLQLYAGADLRVMGEAIPMALGYTSSWVLLMTACTSTTIVYGRLAADNEADALATAGLHPFHTFLPGIVFALLLCGVSYFIHEVAEPWAHYQKRILSRKAVLLLLESPPPGNQTFNLGFYTLSYAHSQDGTMERPILVDRHDPLHRREYTAKVGRFEVAKDQTPIITLVDAESWEESIRDHREHRITGRGDIRIPLDLREWKSWDRSAADLSSAELPEYARTARKGKEQNRAWTLYYSRPAQALAPLLLVLLCAPLGIFVRKGSRMAGLGAAVPPFLLYLVCTLTGEGLANRGQVHPMLAAWLSNMVIAVVALPFLWRVLRR